MVGVPFAAKGSPRVRSLEWWRQPVVRWQHRAYCYEDDPRHADHNHDINSLSDHAKTTSHAAAPSHHSPSLKSPPKSALIPAGIAASRQLHGGVAGGCCLTLVLLVAYLFLPGGPFLDTFFSRLLFRGPRDCDPLQPSPFPATPHCAAPSPPPPCAHPDPLCCASSPRSPTAPSPAPPANVSVWREQLAGVVLAILYNRAPLVNASVTLLRRVYGRVFQDIVVYSDEAIPELGVLPLRRVPGVSISSGKGNATNGNDSSSRERTPWYVAHATLADVFERYPTAAGVLWSNDDVILNYWNLAAANKSRIWFVNSRAATFRWVSFSLWGPCIPNNRDWACSAAIRREVRGAIARLAPFMKRRFKKATRPHKRMYTKRIADLAYIPMRHAQLIAEYLLPAFSRVHSEVAIGNMLLCVEPFPEWDPVLDRMKYLWGDKRNHTNDYYSTDIPALHPWKLSTRGAQQLLLRRMMEADPSLDAVYREFFCG
ncbi:hypothetical protein CLOM_g8823 [Closterium sp. NIES-68]|nr:hypothetical protein CLOM_g8823 [Closterium sp. NIES-68]GJP80619.1 hypothetical protein CLOP_g10821 [Closterium sp. NIES-67]